MILAGALGRRIALMRAKMPLKLPASAELEIKSAKMMLSSQRERGRREFDIPNYSIMDDLGGRNLKK